MKHIVKRKGKEEEFDPKKIYKTCEAACRAAQCGSIEREKHCKSVTNKLKTWIKNKKEVTSDQIFKETGKHLTKAHKKAGYMYEKFRDIN